MVQKPPLREQSPSSSARVTRHVCRGQAVSRCRIRLTHSLRLTRGEIVSHSHSQIVPRISDTRPAMPRQSLLDTFKPTRVHPAKSPSPGGEVTERSAGRTPNCCAPHAIHAGPRDPWHLQRRPHPHLGRKFRRMARRVSRLPVRRRGSRSDGRDCRQVLCRRASRGKLACGSQSAREL